MANDLVSELDMETDRVAVLSNPLDVDAIRAAAECSPELERSWTGLGPHLLAIGRLSGEKGFDLLLEAFDSVRDILPRGQPAYRRCRTGGSCATRPVSRVGIGECGEFCGLCGTARRVFLRRVAVCAFVPARRHAQCPAGSGRRRSSDCGHARIVGHFRSAARSTRHMVSQRSLRTRTCRQPVAGTAS